MIKKIISLFLCAAMCMGIGAVAEEAEESKVEIIEARLDNAVEASKGIVYDKIDPIKNDDRTHGLIYSVEQLNPAYVVYKSTNPFKSFGVEFYSGTSARLDLRFYVSKDGENWKFADIALFALNKLKHTDDWTANTQAHRIFKGNHLEDEYSFIKLEFHNLINSVNIAKIHFSSDDVYDLPTNGYISHSQKPDFDYSTIQSLKEVYKDYFDIGVSVEPWDLEQYEDLIDSQFSYIVNENQFKGHVIQQGPDTWYWSGMDQIVDWGLQHGKKLRGHALWYHSNHYQGFFKDEQGNPVSKEEALKRMEKHVKAKVSHYKGKISSYDTVNEIFDPGSGHLKVYMEEAQICGQDYVPYLFKWAKEIDPDVDLLLCDNSHLIPAMRKGIVEQAKKWLDEGVPIDAIGLQWHETVFSNPEDMRDLFRMLRELGLKVYITEMDISAYRPYDSTSAYKWEDREKVEDAVARAYATTFDIFRENADIIECVSFWNPTDNRSTYTNGLRFETTHPFDMNGKPNKSYYAIIDIDGKMPRMTEDVWDWPELAKTYPEGYEPLIAPVYKGTPVIDGEVDDIWSIAEEMPVKKFALGKDGTTGYVKLLWDDDYLYILGEATGDYTPSYDADGAWNRDCMEAYVSQSNMHVSWVGGGDTQYRIDPTGEMQFFDQGKCVILENGYRYEARIPLNVVKPEPGTIYSFDAGFTDAVDGVQTNISKWCDVTNESYRRTELWGDIIISDGTTPVPSRGTASDNSEKETKSGNYVKAAFDFSGEEKNIPIISENGVSMLAMQDFLKMTGAAVKTDKNGGIDLSVGGKNLKITLNDSLAYINGLQSQTLCTPKVIDKKTYLPLRFVFENLGYTVEWNEEMQKISVR